MDRRSRWAAAGLLAALATAPLWGQAVTGSIFGTVTDPSGASVPNAKISITDVNRNVKTETLTNADGNYTRTQLIPGTYQVEVEASGFRKAVSREVNVNADAAARVDLRLEVGNVAETVEVMAEAPLLRSDRAEVSTTFNSKQLTELPSLDRNFQSYELLVPGTQRLNWTHASSENPQGSMQIMVNGQHFSGTGYQLDGTDNQDPILGIIVVNPALEAVTEGKVANQNYDAEFGQAIAGVVTAQTRSGTNDLHGAAFEFLRNNSPGFQSFARNPFNSAENNGTPPFKWNQFGGALGGPVKKNKLFFFGDYQGTRQRAGTSVLTQVPTALARQGDFSEYLEPLANAPLVRTTEGNQVPLQRNMIFDPTTGDPNTGQGRLAFQTGGVLNRIPAARLSQQALNLVRQLPPPNARDSSGSAFRRNFATTGSGTFDQDQADGRIDWFIGEKASTFGRYTYAGFNQYGPGAFGDLVGGPGIGIEGFGGQSKVRNQSVAYGYNRTFSPTLLTEVRFGFNRYRVNVLPNGFGTSPAREAGIPGLNLDNTFTSGMPAFFINGDGGFNLGYALGTNRCNCPLQQEEQTFQWVSNTTKYIGNHALKFGGDLRYAMQLRVPSDAHRSGELTFNNERTAFVGSQGETSAGLGLGSFMLGDVSVLRRYVSPNFTAAERQRRFYWYAQDTYRVTSKLTLNYGLRWEQVFPETVNKAGNGGQLDLRTGEIAVFGVGGVSMHGIQEMNWKNFAPRLGVTYQLTSKTVVRAGYGWSYALGTFGSIFGHNVTQNLPVLAIQDVRTSSFNQVFTLAQGPQPPVFPAVPQNGKFPLPNGVSGKARPLDLRMPRVMAYNATVQHQLTPSTALEVAYVGNAGRHVFVGDGPDFNVNEAAFVPGVANADQRKPFFSRYGWTQNISLYCNCATSQYDSLQVKLERRFSSGYGLIGHYTYGRGVQDSDSFAFLYNRPLGRGPNDFDRAHVFLLAQQFEVPVGRGRRFNLQSRALDVALGGWSINAITSIEGGIPITPSFDNPDPARFIRPNAGPSGRPDRGQGDPYAPNRGRDQWIARGLGGPFQIPANNQFGNFGRNTLRGPSYFNQDVALAKAFHITESSQVQLRAESYNAFNHTNLGLPNANVTSGDAGRITSLRPNAIMRRLQFGLRLSF